ncbi:MAG: hypothetical protein AAF560_33520 [Acidobacteriota bacterium]
MLGSNWVRFVPWNRLAQCSAWYAAVWVTVGAGLLSSVASPAWAGDVQVNTYTTGAQSLPEIARDAEGNFVVVWLSDGSFGTDDSERSIQGQRFAADGSPLGDEFQVNTYTTGGQRWPSVAMADSGAFVVAWMSEGSYGDDTSDYSVQGQRFASDGTAMGGQFQINSYTTDGQGYPTVGADAEGNFVVAWRSFGSFGDDNTGGSVQAQRFSSSGFPVDSEFQVNTYTTGGQFPDAVAFDGDGDFVIVWSSSGSFGDDDSQTSIQAQRYAAGGNAEGGQFQVNSATPGFQTRPHAALRPNGELVVVWEGQDNDYGGIIARRFAADGSASGNDFRANAYTTSIQFAPRVAWDTAGGFVVTWSSYGSFGNDDSNNSIQQRRYASDGSTSGQEFQVNTVTGADQTFSDLVLDADGNAVIVWGSRASTGTDRITNSIQKTPPNLVFADGFESGDTSAWNLGR